MLNPFVMKKWAAFLMVSALPTVVFFTGYNTFGIFPALGSWIGSTVILSYVGNALIKTPFRSLVEGNGVLALEIDSTGIIKSFIMGVYPPYLRGKDAFGDNIEEVFNRDTIFQFATPVKGGKVQQGQGKDNKVRTALVLNEEDYNKARFGMLQYPCVIFNKQLGCLVTKDWLSDQEKQSFAEHQVLYLNRKVEELSGHVRDFARHVVNQIQPSQFGKFAKIALVILIIGLVILGVIFAPSIWSAISGVAGGVDMPLLGTLP